MSLKELIAARNAVVEEITRIDTELRDLTSKLHQDEQLLNQYQKQLDTSLNGKDE